MTTRPMAHAAASDVSPAPPTPSSTASSGSALDGLSNAPTTTPPLAPQGGLDPSAYEPSPSISAYANAAAVAASTAVLAPATASTTSLGRVRSMPSVSPSSTAVSPPLSSTPPPPPLRTKLPSGRPSSKFGTVNYSIDEMRRLNDKVRAVMPIASEDWLHVAYQFNYMRPESIPYREVESLKRKFKKMYCTRSTPGGQLPDYAQDAKELRRQINQRSERAQIQLETVQSDSQSEIDAQDVTTAPSASDDVTATSEATATDDALVSHATSAMESDVATSESGTEDARDIATRLRLMEDEYHRSMATKRGSTSSITSGPDALGSLGTEHASTVLTASPLGLATSGDATTTGIINLLKHSIERKRRTIEEQMLSESERVRKERKKRKMEQVLYNIHREQTGSTVPNTTDAVSSATAVSLSGITAGGTSVQNLLGATSPSGVIPPSSMSLLGNQDTSSLGMMEFVLQFMIAQQQETARRVQLEEERRRIDIEERDRRRRLKDAQRRKDKHELMLVMAALLQENFPAELRSYLDPTSLHNDSDEQTSTIANGESHNTSATSATDRVVEDALL